MFNRKDEGGFQPDLDSMLVGFRPGPPWVIANSMELAAEGADGPAPKSSCFFRIISVWAEALLVNMRPASEDRLCRDGAVPDRETINVAGSIVGLCSTLVTL